MEPETIIIKVEMSIIIGDYMKTITKSYLAILMGIIIAIADIIWTYQSYYDITWVVLGVIIFVADVIWVYLDYDLMTMGSKKGSQKK